MPSIGRRCCFRLSPVPLGQYNPHDSSHPCVGDSHMERERHPKGLYILFCTEMWERFSFYLMLGILPLYLSDSQKGGMGWNDSDMAVVVGSYTALVYFTPFIGGLIADRLLGCRKTVVIGGIL